MHRWSVFGLVLLGLLVGHGMAQAQNSICPTFSKGLDPVAFETVTVSTVAIGLTAATINATSAAAVFLTIEAQPLRFQTFGTPTATTGHLVEAPQTGNATTGAGTWICGRAALLGLRMIRTGGTDSTVRATFYKAR